MYLLFNLHIWSSSIPKCHLIDENLRAQSFQFGSSQTIILKKNRILCPAILSSFLKRTTLLTCLPILPCLVFSSLTSSSLQLNVIILGTTDCTPTLSGSPVWAAQHIGILWPVAPLVFATYIMYQCPTLCKLWYYDVQKGSCGDLHTVDIMLNIV